MTMQYTIKLSRRMSPFILAVRFFFLGRMQQPYSRIPEPFCGDGPIPQAGRLVARSREVASALHKGFGAPARSLIKIKQAPIGHHLDHRVSSAHSTPMRDLHHARDNILTQFAGEALVSVELRLQIRRVSRTKYFPLHHNFSGLTRYSTLFSEAYLDPP